MAGKENVMATEAAMTKAQVLSLEQELELKDETLRTQADELDALRRELRVKDADPRQLATSQRLVQAEHKKAQSERRELEEAVASQKHEIATVQLGDGSSLCLTQRFAAIVGSELCVELPVGGLITHPHVL